MTTLLNIQFWVGTLYIHFNCILEVYILTRPRCVLMLRDLTARYRVPPFVEPQIAPTTTVRTAPPTTAPTTTSIAAVLSSHVVTTSTSENVTTLSSNIVTSPSSAMLSESILPSASIMSNSSSFDISSPPSMDETDGETSRLLIIIIVSISAGLVVCILLLLMCIAIVKIKSGRNMNRGWSTHAHQVHKMCTVHIVCVLYAMYVYYVYVCTVCVIYPMSIVYIRSVCCKDYTVCIHNIVTDI